LRAEFELTWLRHARRSEIRQSLGYFDALAERYAAALAWLAEQRSHYAAGEAVDAEASSYLLGDYLPLWHQGEQQLRRLADLVGVRSLPPEVQKWVGQAAGD
jgi:hypothetical protein